MSLGAQWYILFNIIAGAPGDPHRPARGHGQPRRPRLAALAAAHPPAIFPAYVTGGITASGGAWNASIVAEIVTYGGTTLTATGLGAYIAHATADRRLPPDPRRRRRDEHLHRRPQPARSGDASTASPKPATRSLEHSGAT